MINGLALLGWNPPHREDLNVIQSTGSVFMKHEVLSMKDLLGTVSYHMVNCCSSLTLIKLESLELNSLIINWSS